jgi:CBS domain-containing protein
MRVGDIMTTAVQTISPGAQVQEAASVMCFNKISGLPVVDAERRLVGVVSEKDVLGAMYPDVGEAMQDRHVDLETVEYEYKDVLHLRVDQIMTRKVVSVSPSAPALKAVSIMSAYRIRRIPVVDDGRLVGILSMGDVHKAIFQKNLPGV